MEIFFQELARHSRHSVAYQPQAVAGEFFETKISHRPFRGCESTSQIGSDRKLGKRQISISKQM